MNNMRYEKKNLRLISEVPGEDSLVLGIWFGWPLLVWEKVKRSHKINQKSLQSYSFSATLHQTDRSTPKTVEICALLVFTCAILHTYMINFIQKNVPIVLKFKLNLRLYTFECNLVGQVGPHHESSDGYWFSKML